MYCDLIEALLSFFREVKVTVALSAKSEDAVPARANVILPDAAPSLRLSECAPIKMLAAADLSQKRQACAYRKSKVTLSDKGSHPFNNVTPLHPALEL